ncbi:hypothetical protein WKG98_08300 [Pantoea agglomerans]|uniref:hypothetical protein n=1 Tax=Enterobacter agglomerans TaxID=549 RepID=UPI003C7B983C
MAHPVKIMSKFKTIHYSSPEIKSHVSQVFDAIETYISNLPQLAGIISSKREDKELQLYFDLFKIELNTITKLKFYEAFGDLNYCSEIKFFIADTVKKENTEVLKIYTTYDEYIVEDPYASGSICDVNNEYAGKLIFDLLLNALYQNNLISLKPTPTIE